jgi:hypothetical protein
MTRSLIVLPVLVVAVLVVAGFVFQAEGQTPRPARIAVVVDAPDVDRAAALLERQTGIEGDVRVARTPTEQLSVTHLLAAKGYDAVVGVGLDRAIAVTPVAARYPATQITTVTADELDAAVTAAAR